MSATSRLRLTGAACASAALMVVGSAPVNAATTSVTAQVNGGGASTLGFNNVAAAVNFPATTLTGTNQTATASFTFDVKDGTGSGAGWKVTANSTQFSDGLGHTLPTTASSITSAPAWACNGGSTCTLPSNTGAGYIRTFDNGAPTPLFNADVNTGMGWMTASAPMGLFVPANTVPGTYSGTWTLTLSSGP